MDRSTRRYEASSTHRMGALPMSGRSLLQASWLLTLLACTPSQPGFNSAGSSDQLYADLMKAREGLLNLSEYRDRPAQAARALGQFELVSAELQEHPDLIALPSEASLQLEAGQQELRAALGIALDTPPRDVSAALSGFATAQEAGQQKAAMQALEQPFFTGGPQATFATLSNLPPLPAVEQAASALALGPPGAAEAVMHQRLHRHRLLRGSFSNWSR
jgi:hypothetical protein